MDSAAALFPGPLGAVYEAFAQAIDAAGGAELQFARTQVACRLQRQFAWLTPVSGTRCLLTLDMYEPHEHPIVDEIIRFRDDKATHQIPVESVATVQQAQQMGWFELARAWGDKQPH